MSPEPPTKVDELIVADEIPKPEEFCALRVAGDLSPMDAGAAQGRAETLPRERSSSASSSAERSADLMTSMYGNVRNTGLAMLPHIGV